jgi:hypothetical protein
MHHREPPDIYLLILPTFTTIVKATGKTPIGWPALSLSIPPHQRINQINL